MAKSRDVADETSALSAGDRDETSGGRDGDDELSKCTRNRPNNNGFFKKAKKMNKQREIATTEEKEEAETNT